MLKREPGNSDRNSNRLGKSGPNTPDRNVIRRDKRNDPSENIERGRRRFSHIEAYTDARNIYFFLFPFSFSLKKNFFRRGK